MTMTNAEWMIKNGYKFSDLDAVFLGLDRGCKIRINGKTVARVPHVDRTNAIICWLDEENKEPILDDAEKRYLSAVIKPFRKHIEHISKHIYSTENREFILFYYKQSVENTNFFYLPTFKLGTMYKGMKVGRSYTLEELGL